LATKARRTDMVENIVHNNHYIHYEPKQLQKLSQVDQQDQSEDNESTTTYNSRKWEDHDSVVGGGSVDVQQQQQHDVALSILSLQPVSMPMIAAVLLLESPQHLDAAAVIVSATATTTEKNTATSSRTTATNSAITPTENKWKKALHWNNSSAVTNKRPATTATANTNTNQRNGNKSNYRQGKSHDESTKITSNTNPCYKRATCNYVYLLPRSWVISWICWAYNQTCTVEELPHKKPLFMELCQLLQLDTNSIILDCFNNYTTSADSSNPTQHQYNPTYSPPGPMDASPLSLMGHPLLLKPNIFFGKGTVPDTLPTIPSTHHISSTTNATSNTQQPNSNQKKQQQRGRSKTKQESTSRIRRSSSLSGLSKLVLEAGAPKVSTTSHYHLLNSTIIGCCAISESFYDYIKSIHGVRCNDFKTVSFQSSSSQGSSSSASSNSGANTEVILHHHIKKQQEKNNKNSANHWSMSTNNTHRSSSLFLSSSKKLLVPQTSRRQNSYDSKSVWQQQVEPKPIEFKRRVIHGIPDIFDPSVMRSMVEIYPIKFLYTVVEPTSSLVTTRTTGTNNCTLHSHNGYSNTHDAIKKSHTESVQNLESTKHEHVLKRSMSDTITTRSFITAVEDNTSSVISSQQTTSKTASSQITYMNILQTAATKLSNDKTNTVNNTTTATMTSTVSPVKNCAPDVDDSETLPKISKLNIQIPEPSSDKPSTNNIVQQFSPNSPKFYDKNHNSKAVSSIVTASGFALISRATPIDQAIKAILHVVASDKSADCKRCWISYSFGNNSSSGGRNAYKDSNKQKQQSPLGVKDVSSQYSPEEADTMNPSFENKHEETRESLSSSSICATSSSSKRNFDSAREARSILGTELGDGYELWTDLFNSNNHQQLSVEDFIQQYNIENVKTSPSASFIATNLHQVKCNIIIETRNNSLKDCYTRQHLELCNRIQVGDFVDAPDKCGKWYEAVVREETEDLFKVHYIGWGSRWDCWIRRFDQNFYPPNFEHFPGPPAPLWSRSSRWRCNAKVGSDVEVREAASLAVRPKWFPAKIVALGRESDPIRSCEGGAQLETLEPDEEDPEKLMPLLLLHRTRQVLVEVPKENFNSHVRAKLLPTTALLESDDPTPNPPYIRWVNLYGEEICNQYTHNAAPGVEAVAPVTIRYDFEASRKPVEVLQTFNNVYGAGFVRESIRGVPPAPGSVGLHNLGNSCFLNSILQCLNHIEPLTQFFLSGAYKTDINKKNPLGSGGIVARAYASLLNDMWSGEYSTLAPRILKTTVAQFAPQFNNCLQHDSQEFCSFLMDGLHEDLNRVIDKPYIEEMEGRGLKDDVVAMESWRRHLLRHDSVIVDHCQGMHRSHLTCPECGHVSVKFDVYSTISLPIPEVEGLKTIPLSASLASFTSVEELDEENAWYCNQCQKHVCAKKRISLWSTPDILILHLKRFTFNKCKRIEGRILRSKVETKVEFPVDGLNMSPYMIGPIDEEALPIYNVSILLVFGVKTVSLRTVPLHMFCQLLHLLRVFLFLFSFLE